MKENPDQAREFAGATQLRIRRMYLAGCAHVFECGWMPIQQVLAVRARDPVNNPLPWTREYICRG